ADSGIGFVLVQHLDPHHKSMLVDLLSRHTAMTVVEAADGVRVAANRVFIIPPNATLTLRNGVLCVSKPAPARESPPTRHGFGSHLIERIVHYELQANVQRDFPAEGVRCTIEFPLTDKTGY